MGEGDLKTFRILIPTTLKTLGDKYVDDDEEVLCPAFSPPPPIRGGCFMGKDEIYVDFMARNAKKT